MIDIVNQLNAIRREAGGRPSEDGELAAVVLRREYGAPADDVWDAITDPDRVRRWFTKLGGELREGGNFQLEGNAGGDIVRCERPSLLRVTFGGPASIVELRLTALDGGRTELVLEHTVPLAAVGTRAGALYVGPGWDGAFMGLDLYLGGHVTEDFDPAAAAGSLEAQEFSQGSIQAWTALLRESGYASAEEIDAAYKVATGQYTPDLDGKD